MRQAHGASVGGLRRRFAAAACMRPSQGAIDRQPAGDRFAAGFLEAALEQPRLLQRSAFSNRTPSAVRPRRRLRLSSSAVALPIKFISSNWRSGMFSACLVTPSRASSSFTLRPG